MLQINFCALPGRSTREAFPLLFTHVDATKLRDKLLKSVAFCDSALFCIFLLFLASDPITAIDVDPPHAVVIGQEAWFNVTLHSNNLVNPEEYSPSYGFVHFMWIFEKDKDEKKKPLLTWDHEVSHTFTTPGKRDVSVTAISVIGQGSAHVSVTVYG